MATQSQELPGPLLNPRRTVIAAVVFAVVAAAAPGVPAALLVALPAISLPSMVLVGRATSWSRTAVIAGCMVVAALLSAGIATLLA